MPTTEFQPLFAFRFSTRTLLIAFAIASLVLALSPLLYTETGIIVTGMAFMVVMFAAILPMGWLVIQNTPRSLGRLTVCHVAIATFLLLGPIASYHINGRAWYDYGLTGWNPPPFLERDGTFGIGDYDPKFTRPGVWPVIGPIMLTMTLFSLALLYVPPLAPIVAVCILVSAIRLRHVLTVRQSLSVWTLWLFGLLPIAYMYYWGGKVIEWLMD